jgi:hypothetical protein
VNDDTSDDEPEDDPADSEATVLCPYCGEQVEIAVDPTGGSTQSYVEDCQVCCQPWQVTVRIDRRGKAVVRVDGLDA